MNIKKGLIGIGIIFVGLISVGTIYLFKTEIFYSEYWLQRQFDNLTASRTSEKDGEPKEVIKYKFCFNPSVDIEIELDNVGNLVLTRHSWFADNNQLRVYNFKVEKNEFEKLKTDFETRWTESNSKDEDFKFGGTYYEIELSSPGQAINIGFYNVTPDKSFTDFKDKIINMVKSVLKSNSR